jgi:autotransporter-associated beta strand protein
MGTFTIARSSGNSYTGKTTIVAGKLLVMSTSESTGSGQVIINNGGVLGGTGTIQDAVTNTGTLAPGTSTGTLQSGGELHRSKTTGRLQLHFEAVNSTHVLGTKCASFYDSARKRFAG